MTDAEKSYEEYLKAERDRVYFLVRDLEIQKHKLMSYSRKINDKLRDLYKKDS